MVCLPLALAASLFFGGQLHPDGKPEMNRYLHPLPKPSAIKKILGRLMPNAKKNEKIGVIISLQELDWMHELHNLNLRQANFVACFRYCDDDEYMTINYFAIPIHEELNDLFLGNYGYSYTRLARYKFNGVISAFIADAIEFDYSAIEEEEELKPKSVYNTDIKTMQFRMRKPAGLQNDCLFNIMHNHKSEQNILNDVSYFRGYSFWGFKNNTIEFIQSLFDYYAYDELQHRIDQDILDPILNAVWGHATPKAWKKDYAKNKRRIKRMIEKRDIEEERLADAMDMIDEDELQKLH